MIRETGRLDSIEMYLTAPLYVFDIPKEQLSLFDKLLFTTIYGLAKNKGLTRVTDKYFMQLLDKSDKTIAKSIKRLDDNGLIHRETHFNRKTSKRNRKIKLGRKTDEVIHAPLEIYLLDITDGAKLLLIQLVGLSKQVGYVYATNQALADKMNISKRMIYRYLKELAIKSIIFIENPGTSQREIYINESLSNDDLILEYGDNFIDKIQDWKEYIERFLQL